MKKIFKLSLTLAVTGTVVLLAGCGGCAGCSGDAKNLTVTSSNWYTGTSYKGIQPSFIDSHEKFKPEIIHYNVSFVPPETGNSTYSVEYDKGTYKTVFYATGYDWNSNPVYPQEREEDEILYCFESEFKIKVKYTLKSSGESTDWFSDSVNTVSYFRAAGKNLQPVYSRQEINSTSPANYQVGALADTYSEVKVNYDNYYNFDCTEVTTFTQENGGEKVKGSPYSFNKNNLSLFDNSSLYIAVRSMKLSPSTSANISLYSPAAGGVSSYSVAGQNKSLNEDEHTAITEVMKSADLFVPEEEVTKVPAVAVNVNYTGGTLYGTTQTIWYAYVSNPDNNTPRATMLKMTVPLSYNLGALNYTVGKIESTLWNG